MLRLVVAFAKLVTMVDLEVEMVVLLPRLTLRLRDVAADGLTRKLPCMVRGVLPPVVSEVEPMV